MCIIATLEYVLEVFLNQFYTTLNLLPQLQRILPCAQDAGAMGWAGALVLSLPVLFCVPQEQLARGGLLLLNGHRGAAGMETLGWDLAPQSAPQKQCFGT